MESILKNEKLIEVIASADESTLRAVLRGLCAEREVEKLVGKHLYEVTKVNAAKADSSGLKRKATSPVHICIQCGQAFEEGDNKKECRYHSEEMEIDYDSSTWHDWDEKTFGKRDTEENRCNPDILGGFVYPCCDQPADESDGCKLGYHRAVDGKRGRFGVDDSTDEDEGDEEDEEDEEDEDDDEGDE
ncbi:hypothetical protein N0V85_000782 [Neurospora sp. IMI 360204]|nr:hypothetical protein N0V85_000782 [Neurospora sp. IMI 360204]